MNVTTLRSSADGIGGFSLPSDYIPYVPLTSPAPYLTAAARPSSGQEEEKKVPSVSGGGLFEAFNQFFTGRLTAPGLTSYGGMFAANTVMAPPEENIRRHGLTAMRVPIQTCFGDAVDFSEWSIDEIASEAKRQQDNAHLWYSAQNAEKDKTDPALQTYGGTLSQGGRVMLLQNICTFIMNGGRKLGKSFFNEHSWEKIQAECDPVTGMSSARMRYQMCGAVRSVFDQVLPELIATDKFGRRAKAAVQTATVTMMAVTAVDAVLGVSKLAIPFLTSTVPGGSLLSAANQVFSEVLGLDDTLVARMQKYLRFANVGAGVVLTSASGALKLQKFMTGGTTDEKVLQALGLAYLYGDLVMQARENCGLVKLSDIFEQTDAFGGDAWAAGDSEVEVQVQNEQKQLETKKIRIRKLKLNVQFLPEHKGKFVPLVSRRQVVQSHAEQKAMLNAIVQALPPSDQETAEAAVQVMQFARMPSDDRSARGGTDLLELGDALGYSNGHGLAYLLGLPHVALRPDNDFLSMLPPDLPFRAILENLELHINTNTGVRADTEHHDNLRETYTGPCWHLRRTTTGPLFSMEEREFCREQADSIEVMPTIKLASTYTRTMSQMLWERSQLLRRAADALQDVHRVRFIGSYEAILVRSRMVQVGRVESARLLLEGVQKLGDLSLPRLQALVPAYVTERQAKIIQNLKTFCDEVRTLLDSDLEQQIPAKDKPMFDDMQPFFLEGRATMFESDYQTVNVTKFGRPAKFTVHTELNNSTAFMWTWEATVQRYVLPALEHLVNAIRADAADWPRQYDPHRAELPLAVTLVYLEEYLLDKAQLVVSFGTAHDRFLHTAMGYRQLSKSSETGSAWHKNCLFQSVGQVGFEDDCLVAKNITPFTAPQFNGGYCVYQAIEILGYTQHRIAQGDPEMQVYSNVSHAFQSEWRQNAFSVCPFYGLQEDFASALAEARSLEEVAHFGLSSAELANITRLNKDLLRNQQPVQVPTNGTKARVLSTIEFLTDAAWKLLLGVTAFGVGYYSSKSRTNRQNVFSDMNLSAVKVRKCLGQLSHFVSDAVNGLSEQKLLMLRTFALPAVQLSFLVGAVQWYMSDEPFYAAMYQVAVIAARLLLNLCVVKIQSGNGDGFLQRGMRNLMSTTLSMFESSVTSRLYIESSAAASGFEVVRANAEGFAGMVNYGKSLKPDVAATLENSGHAITSDAALDLVLGTMLKPTNPFSVALGMVRELVVGAVPNAELAKHVWDNNAIRKAAANPQHYSDAMESYRRMKEVLKNSSTTRRWIETGMWAGLDIAGTMAQQILHRVTQNGLLSSKLQEWEALTQWQRARYVDDPASVRHPGSVSGKVAHKKFDSYKQVQGFAEASTTYYDRIDVRLEVMEVEQLAETLIDMFSERVVYRDTEYLKNADGRLPETFKPVMLAENAAVHVHVGRTKRTMRPPADQVESEEKIADQDTILVDLPTASPPKRFQSALQGPVPFHVFLHYDYFTTENTEYLRESADRLMGSAVGELVRVLGDRARFRSVHVNDYTLRSARRQTANGLKFKHLNQGWLFAYPWDHEAEEEKGSDAAFMLPPLFTNFRTGRLNLDKPLQTWYNVVDGTPHVSDVRADAYYATLFGLRDRVSGTYGKLMSHFATAVLAVSIAFTYWTGNHSSQTMFWRSLITSLNLDLEWEWEMQKMLLSRSRMDEPVFHTSQMTFEYANLTELREAAVTAPSVCKGKNFCRLKAHDLSVVIRCTNNIIWPPAESQSEENKEASKDYLIHAEFSDGWSMDDVVRTCNGFSLQNPNGSELAKGLVLEIGDLRDERTSVHVENLHLRQGLLKVLVLRRLPAVPSVLFKNSQVKLVILESTVMEDLEDETRAKINLLWLQLQPHESLQAVMAKHITFEALNRCLYFVLATPRHADLVVVHKDPGSASEFQVKNFKSNIVVPSAPQYKESEETMQERRFIEA